MKPYHALQQLLDKVDSDVSAASVHGLWCGRLAAGDTLNTTAWWAFTMRVMGQEASIEENMVAAFKAIANFSNQHLQAENFEFEPWLPAEDTECHQRLAALSEWCQGFIEGMTSVLGSKLALASDEVKEIVKDLLDIGDVDADVGGSEEDEKQFNELAEFVKVAALTIWHDFAREVELPIISDQKVQTIH
jgi:uncharacterized protein